MWYNFEKSFSTVVDAILVRFPRKVTYLKAKAGIRSFQVFFIKNDRDQSVYIDEDEKVDLPKIKKHLARGESVFITSREAQKLAEH